MTLIVSDMDGIWIVFVELGVGMNTEGIEVRSVGNTLTLHETALIESFNLQAAIEYQHKHCRFSRICPRLEYKIYAFVSPDPLACLRNFYSMLSNNPDKTQTVD